MWAKVKALEKCWILGGEIGELNSGFHCWAQP